MSMMKIRSRGTARVMAAAIGAGSLLTTAGASAQPASDGAEVSSMQEVIVIARRREERQQDVPLAITALSGDAIKEAAIVNLNDLNGKVPALRIDAFNSPSYTNVGIRAQRSTNVAPGQDAAVGYYFNEYNFSFPVGIAQQLFDLQSVEIVKGPQGTLFGRNTTGGAILISPNKPSKEFEGSLTVGATMFRNGEGYYGTGVANLPVNDIVQFRVGVNIVDRDGYVKNLITPAQLATYQIFPHPDQGGVSDADLNDQRSQAWRIGMLVTPSDRFQTYFLYAGTRSRSTGVAYELTAVNPTGFANFATAGGAVSTFNRQRLQKEDNYWTTESGVNGYDNMSTNVLVNETTFEVSDLLTIKNIAGYRQFKLRQGKALDAMPFQILIPEINDFGREWSEEFQLQGESADQSFDWVAGIFLSGQYIDHPNSTLALPQFGAPPNQQQSLTSNQSRALFAQGTYRFPWVEGLSMTFGARITSDHRQMRAFRFNNRTRTSCGMRDANGALLPIDRCFLSGEVTYTKPTYNLSFDYKINPETLVYLAHRRGYRSGGWNYVPENPQTFGPFRPEYVIDYEVGLKKDWSFNDARLRTNLAIYHQEYSNIQRFSSPVSNPTAFAVINAASAEINGGELEVTFIPVEGLELGAFWSYIDARYHQFITGAGNFTTNKLAQVPKQQYSFNGKYTLPFDESIGAISIQADYTHQSDIFFTDTAQGAGQGPADSQGQKGYGIVNARIDWKSIGRSNFDVGFYVKNATAQEYRLFGIQLFPALGYNIATIGEPRVFGLEASFRF